MKDGVEFAPDFRPGAGMKCEFGVGFSVAEQRWLVAEVFGGQFGW